MVSATCELEKLAKRISERIHYESQNESNPRFKLPTHFARSVRCLLINSESEAPFRVLSESSLANQFHSATLALLPRNRSYTHSVAI